MQRRGAAFVVMSWVVAGAAMVTGARSVVVPSGAMVSGCARLGTGTTGTTQPGASPAAEPAAHVDVDVTRGAGAVNRRLTGLVWNTGSSISADRAVAPAEVRVDGSLQDRSTGPGQLDMQPLVDRIAAVRAIGAEPLVILSYMPRWLGAPRAAPGKDPTRVGPYDLDVWQALVTKVVRTLATAAHPAYRFEVWNEPDIPIAGFWQDTPAEFVAMALRTHQAVATVKRETKLPLQVGGPAAAFGPLSAEMLQYVRAVGAARLPLDFVSWHKYANSPYLGPDGAEGNLSPPIYQALAKRNPNSTPLQYSAEIAATKAQVDATLAGSGLAPRFEIDEWNVSAGGYDVRHDTAEGAALDAGILIEMEKAGLDGADFYRSASGSANHVGDWGLVFADGTPKPSWWVFRAWSLMAGSRLVTSGDDPTHGLWVRATRDQRCVSVLLVNFVATGSPARTVTVRLDGAPRDCAMPGRPTLSRLDATSTSLGPQERRHFDKHHTVTIHLESQSVALLRLPCANHPTEDRDRHTPQQPTR